MDYVALTKEFGGPLALVIVLLYAAGKAGLFRWLYQAHRAVTRQVVSEQELLATDRRDLIGWLRTEIVDLRDQLRKQRAEDREDCDLRITALQGRCDRELAETRMTLAERDRVRRLLAAEIIELRQAMRDHGIPVSDSNRLAELIMAEEQERA